MIDAPEHSEAREHIRAALALAEGGHRDQAIPRLIDAALLLAQELGDLALVTTTARLRRAGIEIIRAAR